MISVLIQDRSAIVVTGREIWAIRTMENEYSIFVDDETRVKGKLGVYTSEDRAYEVLTDLFRSINSGQNGFIMPAK